MGVSVKEMNKETTIEAASVMVNSRNSRPTTPPMSRIGINTATSERLMEMTVNPT